MYSEKYNYAGTCDLLMWDNLKDHAIIMDYKTNEELDKQFGFLLEPFSYSANTAFNKYQIQLSYYQLILEEINIKVEERFIIWLKHDGTYEVRQCFDFTNVLKDYLNIYINESC
jgi:ATP-dependent exoDNAse (exonuclease V) beta subunit